MSTKLSKEDVHLRSQEVQELIGHIPGGFMRYGIGVLFLLLILALLVSNFIVYTEVRSFPLRIIPNVSSELIWSPFDGNIKCCYVSEGANVSVGDTLLAIHTAGKLHFLKAINDGKVKFIGFCVKNEMVQKGQLLMEICDPVVKPQPLFAIADTLPLSLTTKQLQIIEVEICGQKIPFEMVRSIEDTISGKKLVLFKSVKCMELTRQHRGEGRCFSNDGVLLDKLIQIRW